MHTILNLLIVAMAASAPTAGTADDRYPAAVEVFHCTFDDAWDANFDAWPDRWTRKRDKKFPPYLKVGIADEPAPVGRGLRVTLDGGAAAIYSPSIPVAPMFSYVVETQVRTSELVRDKAFVSVTFFDSARKPLDTYRSEPVGKSTPWTRVRVGPIAAARAGADHAVIGLHLEPDGKPDLRGDAWFSDVWVGRVPQMTLTTSRRHNVYVSPEKPEIVCTASGFNDENSRVTFELRSAAGEVLARSEQQFSRDSAPAVNDEGQPVGGDVLAGTARWRPPTPELGFYRVRVAMPGRTGTVHEREISLAIVGPESAPAAGEFGWTLPRGEGPLTLAETAELAGLAGIHWLKFPVWSGDAESTRNERLVWFADRLLLHHIEMVGLLHDPPEEVRKHLGEVERLSAAGIFSTEPELWYPSLEPIITPLSLKVRWWQLGLDQDQSFVGYPRLAEKVGAVRKRLSQFGQQVNLGVGWNWLAEPPHDRRALDFLSLSADPPLTWEEQIAYLAAGGKRGEKRWVVLEPLARDEYSADVRAGDLAQRMLAAKIEGAEGIFVPDVFSTRRGLLDDDGSVGDLLLPWRTTALALAGAKYAGSLRLPGGSPNHVFARGADMVMVVWNDSPREERVFLGDDVEQVDLWGRRTRPPLDADGQQLIKAGTLPLFLVGLSAPLVRCQMSVEFAETRWASVFGKAQENSLSVRNAFGQGISGRIKLVTPDVWRTVPREFTFKLPSGETLHQPFEVTLPFDASSGRQPIRIDFDLTTDRRYQFSVHRHIDVGLDDISAEMSTRLSERGELIVEQRLTNQTDAAVSFKCFLFAPDRRRMVTQVLEHGRGVDLKTFRLADGGELIGKTLWLKMEEINGPRILNYRFVAQP